MNIDAAVAITLHLDTVDLHRYRGIEVIDTWNELKGCRYIPESTDLIKNGLPGLGHLNITGIVQMIVALAMDLSNPYPIIFNQSE